MAFFLLQRDTVAVKPRQYCFRAEILPSQLICTFFHMQEAKPRIALRSEVDSLYGQELYLNVSQFCGNLQFTFCSRVYRDEKELSMESTRWV